MKRSTLLLKTDISDELCRLERAVRDFEQAMNEIDFAAEDVRAYDKAAIGSYIHGFYTGCEHIFRMISNFFENELDAQHWHADLLKRMKLEIPGVRPKVLTNDVIAELDIYRGFRHVFREAYGYELDWKRLKPLAERMPDVAGKTFAQIMRFAANLPDLLTDGENSARSHSG